VRWAARHGLKLLLGNLSDAGGHDRFEPAQRVHLDVYHSEFAGGGIPTVGASGAISGVMGAFLVFFPRSQIKFMIWLIIFVRFFTLVTLIQFMACLPIKMVLRWAFNLKYLVYIPEYFLNI